MPTALITGITGQDGSYLADLLLQKGYRVAGVTRDASVEPRDLIRHLQGRVEIVEGDLRDQGSLERAVASVEPDEVYNLGALTGVHASWDDPVATADVTGLGALRLLDAVRRSRREAKVFIASSSEIFGAATESPQTERTPIAPRTPYGAAKAFAHTSARLYREHHRMFVVVGILFNHESPRRPLSFVTRKVTDAAARIAAGKADRVTLGDLDARRDWGYAGDVVDAMWRSLQHGHADDYVIGTGEARAVRDLCEVAFRAVGLDYRDHVVRDERLVRPGEGCVLVADARKARSELGWEPTVPFERMIEMMVEADVERHASRTATPAEGAGQ